MPSPIGIMALNRTLSNILNREKMVVLERAEIHIKEDLVADAVRLLRTRGLALTRQYTGCRSFKVMQCVEHPDRIMFLAEWDSIEAHQESRHEPAHVEFREMLLPYAAGAVPTVHFIEVEAE